jgi:hypothetical protein
MITESLLTASLCEQIYSPRTIEPHTKLALFKSYRRLQAAISLSSPRLKISWGDMTVNGSTRNVRYECALRNQHELLLYYESLGPHTAQCDTRGISACNATNCRKASSATKSALDLASPWLQYSFNTSR